MKNETKKITKKEAGISAAYLRKTALELRASARDRKFPADLRITALNEAAALEATAKFLEKKLK